MGGAQSTADKDAYKTARDLDYSSKHLKTLENIEFALFSSLVTLNLSKNELESLKGINNLHATLEELNIR